MREGLKVVSLFLAMFVLGGCVGGTKRPDAPIAKNVLWEENKNVDADEYEGVDVSDLSKDVSSTQDGGAQQGVLQRIAFPEAEYQLLPRSGKGTIQGSVYLQDVYGKKIMGNKTRLYLNPVTSYSSQWYEKSYLDGQKMGEADTRLYNYLRFTASDENGAFAFYGVPSGKYYLIGTVICGAECGFDSDKNVRIAVEVEIEGNQIIAQDLGRALGQ